MRPGDKPKSLRPKAREASGGNLLDLGKTRIELPLEVGLVVVCDVRRAAPPFRRPLSTRLLLSHPPEARNLFVLGRKRCA